MISITDYKTDWVSLISFTSGTMLVLQVINDFQLHLPQILLSQECFTSSLSCGIHMNYVNILWFWGVKVH